MLCEDLGQKWGQSLGTRVWRRCSKEAHGADLEVVLLSWLGWGKVVDVDNWQLLRVLRPKRKESPMPASVLDLCREEGKTEKVVLLLERGEFHGGV